MLKTETVIINEKEYVRTWSDEQKKIERDGILYEEALDPAELARVYNESDEFVEDYSEFITGDEFMAKVEEVL